MMTGDQSEIIELLGSPATYGGAEVQRIDTHTALVFLAGPRAWKLKRAVKFDYLDSSTPERRKQLCQAEVALSRRTAPAIYRGVVPFVTLQLIGLTLVIAFPILVFGPLRFFR